jgi:hypothetical protein
MPAGSSSAPARAGDRLRGFFKKDRRCRDHEHRAAAASSASSSPSLGRPARLDCRSAVCCGFLGSANAAWAECVPKDGKGIALPGALTRQGGDSPGSSHIDTLCVLRSAQHVGDPNTACILEIVPVTPYAHDYSETVEQAN